MASKGTARTTALSENVRTSIQRPAVIQKHRAITGKLVQIDAEKIGPVRAMTAHDPVQPSQDHEAVQRGHLMKSR